MTAKKVLVVYQHLPHYRHAVFTALEETNGFEFHFAAGSSSRDGSIPVLNEQDLANVHSLRNLWVGPLLWQLGLVRLLIRRWDSVIFLGDSAYLSTWFGAALCRVLRKRVYFWTIGWHRPDSGLKKLYRLSFYHLAHELLLYGDVPKQIGTDMGFPADRMHVIYNSSGGPSEQGSTPTISAPPPQSSPVIVGAVIRLNPIKRLDLLIHAVHLLRERGRNIAVHLVGEGPERATLAALASHLDVPLKMPGAAYGTKDIRDFYAQTSVTVVPSVAGLTTIQSMRYGRPVITHDNMHEQAPESEAIHPGVTGSLYRQEDVSDLAGKIDLWISRQQVDYREAMNNCHQEVLSRWTGRAHAKAITSIISKKPEDRS